MKTTCKNGHWFDGNYPLDCTCPVCGKNNLPVWDGKIIPENVVEEKDIGKFCKFPDGNFGNHGITL